MILPPMLVVLMVVLVLGVRSQNPNRLPRLAAVTTKRD